MNATHNNKIFFKIHISMKNFLDIYLDPLKSAISKLYIENDQLSKQINRFFNTKKPNLTCHWMRKAILDHNSTPTSKISKDFSTVDDLLEIMTKKSKPNLDPLELYKNSITRQNTKSCPICMEYFNPWKPKLMVVSCCFKIFHSKCLNSLHRLTNASETSCPCCRQSFSAVKVPSLEISFHIITRAVDKIRAHWKGYYLRVKHSFKNILDIKVIQFRIHYSPILPRK